MLRGTMPLFCLLLYILLTNCRHFRNDETALHDGRVSSFALLIGNDFDEETNGAKANVKLFERFLKSRGFQNIKVLINSEGKITKDSIFKYIEIASDTLIEGGTFILYYSGHGFYNDAPGAKFEFGNIFDQGVFVNNSPLIDDEFHEYWYNFRDARIISVFDACYSESSIFLAPPTPNIQTSLVDTSFKPMRSTILHFGATSNDRTIPPDDSPLLPSVFTQRFIDILKSGAHKDYRTFFKSLETDRALRRKNYKPKQFWVTKNGIKVIDDPLISELMSSEPF